MKVLIFVTLVFCLFQLATLDTCGSNTSTGIVAADKTALLNSHNTYRAKVANGKESSSAGGSLPSAADMDLLAWNDELAQLAQSWADQLVADCNGISHNPNRETKSFSTVGENIYWDASTSKPSSISNTLIKASNAWYSEVSSFDPNGISDYSFSSQTGHFTQLIWATTTSVGCGYAVYSDNNFPYNEIVVCDYGPAGNYISDPIYIKGTACSQCPNSLPCSTAYPGLCGVDPSTSYGTYFKLSTLTIFIFTFIFLS